jgi:dihydropteroate synthase
MPRVCADYDVAVVKMASPPDLERPGAVEAVDDIYAALQRDGLTEKTIVDPAFGGWSEAKTLADDRETFHRLREFRALGKPILVSINRKNFLRELAGRETDEALPVSLAATSMAVERGAHVLRTHDVAETRDAALVGDAFTRERARDEDFGVEELDVTTTGDLARHVAALGGDADPDGGVCRAFAISGLSPAAREAFSNLVTGRNVVLTGSDDAVVLAGPIDTLLTLANRSTGPPQLTKALERVHKACR